MLRDRGSRDERIHDTDAQPCLGKGGVDLRAQSQDLVFGVNDFEVGQDVNGEFFDGGKPSVAIKPVQVLKYC